jgi:hypothetical protein
MWEKWRMGVSEEEVMLLWILSSSSSKMKECSEEAILSTAEEAEGVDGKLLGVTDSLGLILFGIMMLCVLLVARETGEGVFEMEWVSSSSSKLNEKYVEAILSTAEEAEGVDGELLGVTDSLGITMLGVLLVAEEMLLSSSSTLCIDVESVVYELLGVTDSLGITILGVLLVAGEPRELWTGEGVLGTDGVAGASETEGIVDW